MSYCNHRNMPGRTGTYAAQYSEISTDCHKLWVKLWKIILFLYWNECGCGSQNKTFGEFLTVIIQYCISRLNFTVLMMNDDILKSKTQLLETSRNQTLAPFPVAVQIQPRQSPLRQLQCKHEHLSPSTNKLSVPVSQYVNLLMQIKK